MGNTYDDDVVPVPPEVVPADDGSADPKAKRRR
jgi:hypothetical protein